MNTRTRRRALLVGVNYHGTPKQLKGCAMDAKYIQHLLLNKFGYKPTDVNVLTDQRVRSKWPTRENILRG